MPEHTPRPGTNGPRTALWLIAVLLAFIAGNLATRSGAGWLPAALAQVQPLVGARGVYAFTGQLDSNRHGLFMLDVDAQTVWCYEIVTVDGERRLRLIAARSWTYDRYLRNFNVDGLDWKAVQSLVALEREQTAGASDPAGSPTAASGADKRPGRGP